MREYELTVVYDLAVAEAGGADAAVEHLTNLVQSRGGTVSRIDHWGRRRMAYPIKRAIDADYVVSRVELDPAAITPIEAALRIDERVYRHLVVRADELPEARVRQRHPAAPPPAPAGQAEVPPSSAPAGGATPPAAAEASEPQGPPPPVDPTAADVHLVTDPEPGEAPLSE